jgi:dolichol-phosphate mannosyltransferase
MIHLVLPVYNEAENLPALIRDIRKTLDGTPYRAVAVDDGSTDGSSAVLRQLLDKDLTIVGSVVNMNVGAVFSTGIAEVLRSAADDDVLVIVESDQTSDIGLVPLMAAKIATDAADVVIASRYVPGGRYAGFPWPRLVLSHVANRLLGAVFPLPGVRDYSIFFRAYRVGILRQAVRHFGLFGLIQSRGFAANPELLVKLSLFTKRIVEIPSVYDYGRRKGASGLPVLATIREYGALVGYLRHILRKHAAAQGARA